jgi:hypothetical protein
MVWLTAGAPPPTDTPVRAVQALAVTVPLKVMVPSAAIAPADSKVEATVTEARIRFNFIVILHCFVLFKYFLPPLPVCGIWPGDQFHCFI